MHTVYIPPTQGKALDYELFRQGESLLDAIDQYTVKRITKRRLLEVQKRTATLDGEEFSCSK